MGQDMENDKMKVWRFNVAGVLLIVGHVAVALLASITNSGVGWQVKPSSNGYGLIKWLWWQPELPY